MGRNSKQTLDCYYALCALLFLLCESGLCRMSVIVAA